MISINILIYILVRFLVGNNVILNPGWHTTIYPPETVAVIITLLFPFFSLLVYALFKWINKVF
jgi:hypothetical protein